MNSKKVTFKNNNGAQLSGRLEMPADNRAEIFAIFAHCFTCSKDLHAAYAISRALSNKGIGVLRFDFTGLGESDGEFANSNFSSNISDLISAADFLSENYKAPQLLIGHSLGGAAVLRAGCQLTHVKCLATIGAPSDPPHVKKLLKNDIDDIISEGEAEVNLAGRTFTIKKQFIDDLEKYDLETSFKETEASILIFHSPQDQIVDIENAREIYNAAHHPKSFVSLDGADHLLTKKEDALYVAEVMASWAERYIEFPQEHEEIKSEKQVTTRTGDDGYTTMIKAGPHKFLADEPASLGGSDLGATPYDLLVASLGACTGMTLRMYADRKNWPLDEVRVHLQHGKVHAKDCDSCEDAKTRIDVIDRELEIIGDLDDKQIKRLIEIADKCPVHKTLHNKIQINTKLTSHE